MEAADYLEWTAKKIREAQGAGNKAEAIRLLQVVADACLEAARKLEKSL